MDMNGFQVRLKNRRVFGAPHPDGDDTYYKFTNLVDGKRVCTKIRLSDEALLAMMDIRQAIHDGGGKRCG